MLPTRKKRVTKTKKGKVAKLSAPVRKAVTSIVKGQAETKYCFDALGPTSFNSAIANTSEWYNCLPDVAMGGQDSAGNAAYLRVGTKIEPTSLKLNWSIAYNSVQRSCDNYVVLYVFRMKGYKTYDTMKNSNLSQVFLDQAQGGYTGFNGYTQQIMTPLNRTEFILVAKKVIHLQKGVGLLNNDITEGYSGNGNKTCQQVSITVKPPKLVYAEGGTIVQPNNYGLCWALGYAHTDGSLPDNAYQDINVVQTAQLYFKDM